MDNTLLPLHLPARGPRQAEARLGAAGATAAVPLAQRLPCPARGLYRLEPGGLLTLKGGKGRTLCVQAGRLWITEPGDLLDHFVAVGERYHVRGKGPVVLQCDSAVAAAWSG